MSSFRKACAYHLSLLALLLFTSMRGIAGSNEVVVQVRALQQPSGSVKYNYTVQNNSRYLIQGFEVGGESCLGWAGAPDGPRTADSAEPEDPPASPKNWRGQKLTLEEMSYVHLMWRVKDGGGIQPGKSESGFSILVPRQNPKYLRTCWTADLSSGVKVRGSFSR